MRPIVRGENPTSGKFDPYNDARPYLKKYLGDYCCYCERELSHAVEIDHIKPKKIYEDLEHDWDNFMLSCKNCNSNKGSEDIELDNTYLPDRDNTFYAFVYLKDGHIKPSRQLPERGKTIAENTIRIFGLDKDISHTDDENLKGVQLDRISDRQEAYGIAEEARGVFEDNESMGVLDQIVSLAKENGFFSIWMHVFSDYQEVRESLIDEFPGTASDCFDANTDPVSPRPLDNVDHLNHAAKI